MGVIWTQLVNITGFPSSPAGVEIQHGDVVQSEGPGVSEMMPGLATS